MVVNIQDDILRLSAVGLLEPLLKDKATKGNILWATDAYAGCGVGYGRGEEIRTERITGKNSDLIKTRARRAMEQRTARTRQHAEVFTPLWVVKRMNDVADVEWFGRKAGFDKRSPEGKVSFTKEKTWKKYADARRLEITCGEAPFLATRYDVETGEALPVEERFGLLDRKLRAVSENAADEKEWRVWALRAVQSIYGYELQGDNLLIARVNLLCSVEEHHLHRWKRKPDKAWLERLCNVISWNLWQMDGLTGCVPMEPEPAEEQLSLFPPEPRFEQESLFGEKEEKEIPCRLFDWRGDHSIRYHALREKGPELMKFDFIIGNPPYQSDVQNQGDRANPIYDKFMDATYSLADCVELIHPARFLFNAGQTSKQWNAKMLNDQHFTVLYFESDASKIFPNTDIKGGVAISLHNQNKEFGAIGTFASYTELNAILRKVCTINHSGFLDSIVSSRGLYRFSNTFYADYPQASSMVGAGSGNMVVSNIFDKFDDAFHVSLPSPSDEYVAILGRKNNTRILKYIKRVYLLDNEYLDCYNVMLAEANGTGKFGEVLSSPFVAPPKQGATDTFISIGHFDAQCKANALLQYIKTKFARTMLGVNKATQHNPKSVWKAIPLQDFTPASDIDWSKSIPEIDRQLYAKYGLDDAEIAFIESHVKEMN